MTSGRDGAFVIVVKLPPKHRICIDGQVTIFTVAGQTRVYGVVGKGNIRVYGKGGQDRSYRVDDELIDESADWETSPELLERYKGKVNLWKSDG
jgi:hypothetical protein